MPAFLLILAAAAAMPVAARESAPSQSVSVLLDPQRRALARELVAKLLTEADFRQMATSMIGNMSDSVNGELKRQFLAKTMSDLGYPAEAATTVDPRNADMVLEMLDPDHGKRDDALKDFLSGQVREIILPLEPQMREAMILSYGRTFNPSQLTDLIKFFGTPTGSFYAAHLNSLMNDPAVIRVFSGLSIVMAQRRPAMVAKITSLMASFTPARPVSSLSAEERAKLVTLLGSKAAK